MEWSLWREFRARSETHLLYGLMPKSRHMPIQKILRKLKITWRFAAINALNPSESFVPESNSVAGVKLLIS